VVDRPFDEICHEQFQMLPVEVEEAQDLQNSATSMPLSRLSTRPLRFSKERENGY
jgi:hypothetical protein